jgi:Ni,Fe-hydrogenase III large subunit
MLAQCALLREQVLRVAGDCFGHRLMMDGIVPGGVARDLTDIGRQRIAVVAGEMKRRVPELARIYADKTSLMDRTVGTGRVSAALVRSFAVGGFVGRASGRAIDVRRLPGYPPYDQLTFTVATAAAGDVDARIGVRLQEIGSSLDIIEQVLDLLPAGPLAVPVEPRAGEGLALVEGFRGDILCWVALDADGTVRRCHPRDPSWFQWPLLEAAIEGNIIADFPLCNKSFNCSYSGQDL